MTSFYQVTRQMTQQKLKYAYLLFGSQIIITIVLALYAASGHMLLIQNFGKLTSFSAILNANLSVLTIYLDLIFFAIMAWQNEQINLSTTWRLIPITSGKFYTANVLSTLLNCIILFVAQNILGLIFALPNYHQFLDNVLNLQTLGQERYAARLINIGIYLVLLVIVLSCFISFANFSSQILTAYLPIKSMLIIRLIIAGFVIVVITYLFILVDRPVGSLFGTNQIAIISNIPSLTISYLEFLLFSLLFGFFDITLLKKRVEAKNYKFDEFHLG